MHFRIVRRDQPTPPAPAELQTQLLTEALFPCNWSNSPGDTYAPHAHDYDKVIVVARGSITWTLGAPETPQTIETCAGARIDLPRGTLHAAEVGPEGVICLAGHIV
jgi:quercetin dioxygenase-like cupin family protein